MATSTVTDAPKHYVMKVYREHAGKVILTIRIDESKLFNVSRM
jgi:hypothetical protein